MGSKVDNTNVLTEVRDYLKKSLEAWESFLNGIEAALVYDKDWALAEEVSGPIVKSVNKIEQVLELSKKEMNTCERCHTQVSESKVCVLCHLHICNSCIDWHCMAKTDTKAIICKECSQLFENCSGSNSLVG